MIVPVYNSAPYLRTCLDSIFAQRGCDLEIICVDDGSTDGSYSILSEYAARDSRVQVISQSNQRQGAARNRGLEIATGGYVFFMDSDDVLYPGAFGMMLKVMEMEHADIVTFAFNQGSSPPSFAAGMDAPVYKVTDFPLDYCDTREGYRIVCSPCRLYRKSILESVRFLPGISYEDEAFSWEVMLKCPRVVMLKNVLYFYRQNEMSTMHRRFSCQDVLDFQCVIEYLLDRFPHVGKCRAILNRKIIPRLLKEQYGRIHKMDNDEERRAVINSFDQELRVLKRRGAYSFVYVGLKRWWRYSRLVREGI